jgi:hypothetical protein
LSSAVAVASLEALLPQEASKMAAEQKMRSFFFIVVDRIVWFFDV